MVRIYRPTDDYIGISNNLRGTLTRVQDLDSAYYCRDMEEVKSVILDGEERGIDITMIWLSDGWYLLNDQIAVDVTSMENGVLYLATLENLDTRAVFVFLEEFLEEGIPGLFLMTEIKLSPKSSLIKEKVRCLIQNGVDTWFEDLVY